LSPKKVTEWEKQKQEENTRGEKKRKSLLHQRRITPQINLSSTDHLIHKAGFPIQFSPD